MPKVSVNILTKNRAEFLSRALTSVGKQSYTDFEVIAVNDGSTDDTDSVLESFKTQIPNLRTISHNYSLGITASRQEALTSSSGEYVAVLDDDDEWADIDKLKKQAEFLDKHQEYVLVGGGIKISNIKYQISKLRPKTDRQIRRSMLLRNNFFTSTVMFRREAAIKAGGFIKDKFDLAEDYHLWLKMGKLGKMANFKEVFANYRAPDYNKEKFLKFLQKQALLVLRHKRDYPFYFLAAALLKFRIILKL